MLSTEDLPSFYLQSSVPLSSFFSISLAKIQLFSESTTNSWKINGQLMVIRVKRFLKWAFSNREISESHYACIFGRVAFEVEKSRKYLRVSSQRYAINLKLASIYQKNSMRSRLRNSSRVPAYQNGRKLSVSAIFCVKPLPWRGLRGLGRRLRPIIMVRRGRGG